MEVQPGDQYIEIIFDGPPGPESGRFIEVENEDGESISVGSWIEDKMTGQWRLRIKTSPTFSAAGEIIHGISTSKGFAPPTEFNLPEKLMLGVRELSEALEAHRNGEPLYWIDHDEGGKPEGVLAEIGDCIIRCLHMMHSLIDNSPDSDNVPGINRIIMEKVTYNATRPEKHGKRY